MQYGPGETAFRKIKSFGSVSAAHAKPTSHATGQEFGQLPYYEELLSFFTEMGLQAKYWRTPVHGDFKMDNLVSFTRLATVVWYKGLGNSNRGPSALRSREPDPASTMVGRRVVHISVNGTVVDGRHYNVTDYLRRRKGHRSTDHPRECREWDQKDAGWDVATRDLNWAVAFTNFRGAVVLRGIAAIMATGQASGINARGYAMKTVPFALWPHA